MHALRGAAMTRVSLLMPALDEEGALPGILARIPGWVDRVVVADNGSTDRTAEVARVGGAEVVREEERGYGAACLAGIRHLSQSGTAPDVLVFMDADGSDDPADIERLIMPIHEGRADLVLGVRRGVKGEVGTILPHARLGNRIVLGLVWLLFRKRFADLPPFRAISFDALQRLEMDDRNWGWTLQMQIRAARTGLAIEEVEVGHRRRTEGVSKISGRLSMSLRVGAKMFWTLGRERLR
ncbi:MAG: glycosyltransferase family 2 protein [Gemmatimonadota bacterium]|nr:glycosyltransferase family 2 protein [Gemmatimonadota bacterium]